MVCTVLLCETITSCTVLVDYLVKVETCYASTDGTLFGKLRQPILNKEDAVLLVYQVKLCYPIQYSV